MSAALGLNFLSSTSSLSDAVPEVIGKGIEAAQTPAVSGNQSDEANREPSGVEDASETGGQGTQDGRESGCDGLEGTSGSEGTLESDEEMEGSGGDALVQNRMMVDANDQMDAQADTWQACGTCEWQIDGGVLRIRPQNGSDAGELECGSSGSWPWAGDAESITSISSEGTIKVATLKGIFDGCKKLTDVSGVAAWDTSEVTDMSFAFYECLSLTSLDGLENWNTSRVANMDRAFSGCHRLLSLGALRGWQTLSVTSMEQTFADCLSLTSLDGLENWNTSNVTNMTIMFHGCWKLSSLDALTEWDTSSVENLPQMFAYCSSLESVDGLQDWDVSKVKSMARMFVDCKKLEDITPLANWEMNERVLTSEMFLYCPLIQIDFGPGWKVAPGMEGDGLRAPEGNSGQSYSDKWVKVDDPSSPRMTFEELTEGWNDHPEWVGAWKRLTSAELNAVNPANPDVQPPVQGEAPFAPVTPPAQVMQIQETVPQLTELSIEDIQASAISNQQSAFIEEPRESTGAQGGIPEIDSNEFVHWGINSGLIITALYGAAAIGRRRYDTSDLNHFEEEVLDRANRTKSPRH